MFVILQDPSTPLDLFTTWVRSEYLANPDATPTPTPPPEPDPVTVCRTAESMVLARLRAPSTADWTGNCWRANGRGRSGYTVWKEDADTAIWIIGVDAQNAFGAMLRTYCQFRVEWRTGAITLEACE